MLTPVFAILAPGARAVLRPELGRLRSAIAAVATVEAEARAELRSELAELRAELGELRAEVLDARAVVRELYAGAPAARG